MLDFHIYDVFTDTPFTGNPLAIVEGADGLTTAQMQTIARQFNLSETIFVQTPDDPAHTAKVRIFFPTAEIPFAGHPTIGCALHLANGTPEVTLEEVAGLVPVTIAEGIAEFTAPKLPTARPAPDRATTAAAMGLTEADLTDTQIGHFEGGPSFVYAELKDLETLARAWPQEPAFSQMSQAADGTGGLCAYVRTGHDSAQSRMFDPPAGIMEDPATGSATAIFAAQLSATGHLSQSGTTTFHLKQGVEMGRPSALRLTIDTDQGRPSAIRVAGQAVKIAHGQIRIP
ncbi:PhzF family phenazine biosynthesis protein [Gymnodinialimonas hymeniacidonis]|uniref:PhzF family phenazine biosynthesis protein n=1 Tax=Gymnodinialimonas hymeniacidonis TaxID=3126508 RepID=UPI0034C62A66